MRPTLWLIGMMGSGKTTVAPLVAGRLGIEWTDMDGEIERSAGRPVSEILAESQSAFRRLELDAVERLAGSNLVVACGGGVVTTRDAVTRMRESGTVVWLRADTDVLAARVSADEGSRPLLGDDPADDLRRISDERADLYRTAAHAVVVTGEQGPADVADEVVRAWKSALSAG